MARSADPTEITGATVNPVQYMVRTALQVLPGVFSGGPRGPTPGQQLRLTEAGYVRQETRGGRFPLVTWLTPTGQVIGNEAARGVAHDLPRTPGINPTVPGGPPAAPSGPLDALLRNRTFVPRGGTVTSAPPSDFDRLIIGRTYNPPDMPPRRPTAAPRGGAPGEFSAAAGSFFFQTFIRPWLIRRRVVKKRGRAKRPGARAQPRPGSIPPASPPFPTVATQAPPRPSIPPRRVPVSRPQPSALPPRPRPESTVAQTYRVPVPSTGSIALPQPRQIPGSAPAPSPSVARRSLLDPFVALLGLPPVLATRTGVANFAPPQFSTPSQTVPRQLSMPDPRPLTQFQTQPLGSTSDCSCGPKPTRTRTKKCTNPIVSTRKRGDLIITTRRLECP